MKEKFIYLLIGPKGSGKSFIGTLMEQYFGIKFVRVEDWAKAVKRDREIHDEGYLQEVFESIESGIRKTLNTQDKITFESTGLTPYFTQMYNNLSRDFSLVSININADDATCIKRVKERDQSIHIHVSDEQLCTINKQVRANNFKADFTILNQSKTEEKLVQELKKNLFLKPNQ